MIKMGSCWASVVRRALAKGGTQLLGIRQPTSKNNNTKSKLRVKKSTPSITKCTETTIRVKSLLYSRQYHGDRLHASSIKHQQTWFLLSLESFMDVPPDGRRPSVPCCIQLFRQRLSNKSEKKRTRQCRLVLWVVRVWRCLIEVHGVEKEWRHEFVLFPSTRWNTLSSNHRTLQSPLPIITFDIVA